MNSKITMPDTGYLVLIDTTYLYKATKSQEHGAKIDYSKFLDWIIEDIGLNARRVIAFVLDTSEKLDEDSGFEAFIRRLKDLGIETYLYKPRGAEENYRTDCHVLLSCVAMKVAQRAGSDGVLLVSGDQEFIPLVDTLKGIGCKTSIMAYSRACNRELRRLSDEFFSLDASKLKMPEDVMEEVV